MTFHITVRAIVNGKFLKVKRENSTLNSIQHFLFFYCKKKKRDVDFNGVGSVCMAGTMKNTRVITVKGNPLENNPETYKSRYPMSNGE